MRFEGDTDSLLGHVAPISKLRRINDREGERERGRGIRKRGGKDEIIHTCCLTVALVFCLLFVLSLSPLGFRSEFFGEGDIYFLLLLQSTLRMQRKKEKSFTRLVGTVANYKSEVSVDGDCTNENKFWLPFFEGSLPIPNDGTRELLSSRTLGHSGSFKQKPQEEGQY